MLKKRSCFVLALFLSVFLFTPSVFAQTPASIHLKILETTDVHGAVFPYDFINAKPMETSLAQVSTYVKAQRSNKDQEVILLDDGDIMQGQPIVYYYNFEEPTSANILAEIMNDMQYDAVTVGNHDIETGHSVYDKVAKEFRFPWLAANAVKEPGNEPYFKPYAVIQRRGLKIAVLGLTTPRIPDWLPKDFWYGMKFEDMIESARKWVKIIQEKEKPDVLIGLFHAGVDYTYGGATAETPYNENASRLVAERVAGFDVVFAGHDHKGWNMTVSSPVGQEVLLLGGLSDARTVAVADLSLTYDTVNKSRVKAKKGEIIDIKNYQADPDFMKKFQPAYDKVKGYVSKKIGTFTQSITTRDSLFGDSAFVDIIHQLQLDITKADISIAAPLSFDAAINSGDVFVRDMFNLYKYENFLYTMTLTGKEIKDFLEYSYANWFNTMKGPEDNLILFKRDAAGNLIYSERDKSYETAERSYNYDSAAGIIYTVDVSKPLGERITISSMANGSPFDMNKKYKVAINSYRGAGGGGHLQKGAGIPKAEISNRMLSSTTKNLRYYLTKWIEEKKTVNPEPLNNWKVVPAEWWQQAKTRDYKLLYEVVK
jgi:2',3'-cyclic-nucleotide 2'-phosphodiesterase/3'-nucleotidase